MHNGPRETLAYVPAIIPEGDRPDYLCTVDLDPDSPTYSKVCNCLTGPVSGTYQALTKFWRHKLVCLYVHQAPHCTVRR